MGNGFPLEFHPCWSNNRSNLWERIHLPVAPYCNVKCVFCDHQVGVSCHIPKPGAALKVMTPTEAISCFKKELKKRPNLRIAAISGPGEPLANPQTFETLRGIKTLNEEIDFCLSTNGILLEKNVNDLVDLHVKTISVSISTENPDTAARIYEWVINRGIRLSGKKMGSWIVSKQIAGIQCAIECGILLKANSIIIPGINDTELESLAQSLSDLGVKLQNIIPLVPYDNLIKLSAPTPEEIRLVREKASLYLKQFTHCAQCRCDVVGIPGNDSYL